MSPLAVFLLVVGIVVILALVALLLWGGVRQLYDQLGRLTSEINRRLEEGLKLTQEANRHVGDRLDNAARVVGEVQNKLGELSVATREVQTIGKDISQLQEALRSPKFRGGFGEFLLENILTQILPKESYELQYRFPSGEIVDAIVKTREGMVPIDAKFPLSNFKRLVEAKGDPERQTLRREFIRDVRRHIEATAKYIRPEEGTLPFALMYIPAENVFYEVILKDSEVEADFLSFAHSKKVFPVSPISFCAYLQTIAIGLRGMKIEEWARTIDDNLQGLKEDLGRFVDEFLQVGGHLKNLRQKYESAERRLDDLQEDLNHLEIPSREERLKVLPGASSSG